MKKILSRMKSKNSSNRSENKELRLQYINNYWEDEDNETIIVLLCDGDIVGSVKTSWNNNEKGWIYGLQVDEKHRHLGYGAYLLNAAEESLKWKGVKEVLLNAQYNEWTRHWYCRNGYAMDDDQLVTLKKTLTSNETR